VRRARRREIGMHHFREAGAGLKFSVPRSRHGEQLVHHNHARNTLQTAFHASHCSLERPRRVIAANIPHMRGVLRRPPVSRADLEASARRQFGIHDDAIELAARRFDTNPRKSQRRTSSSLLTPASRPGSILDLPEGPRAAAQVMEGRSSWLYRITSRC
jgi:hypothetical protein